ncbi:MAG: glycosyltransferase [Ruminococcus sp.]|nr:glycosyltransferase [Ruminococcus sp.]
MACEKAVITTNSGGIPEYTNNECAVLLNRDDNIVRNIAKNIDYLLTNEDIKKNIEKNARQYIMNYFDSNLYLDKMIELLK